MHEQRTASEGAQETLFARRDRVIWAAGFFDGEGCICIHRQTRGVERKVYYYLSLTVFQNHREPLDLFNELWGGAVAPATQGKAPAWTWRAGGPVAGPALREMLPFLRVKRRQAEVAIQFQARRIPAGQNRPPDFCGNQDEADFCQVRDLKRVIP